MLILPSPSTDALKKLLPHFYRQTGIKVNLAVYPYDEVLKSSPIFIYILITIYCESIWRVFPGFAEKVLLPLESVSSELPLLLENFSEQIQHHFSMVNGTAWAIPFDASMQLLFYRRICLKTRRLNGCFMKQREKS